MQTLLTLAASIVAVIFALPTVLHAEQRLSEQYASTQKVMLSFVSHIDQQIPGMTLSDWLAAIGLGSYACRNDKGQLALVFSNLVPGGAYSLKHNFLTWPLAEESENKFIANAHGEADFAIMFTSCLPSSGLYLLSELAIVWHSDGKYHDSLSALSSSQTTHVQLIVEQSSPIGT